MSNIFLIKEQPVYFDTLIFAAAKQGDLAKVQEYIEQYQGWIDTPNAKGNSMLSIAAKNGRVEVVTYLLKRDALFYPNLKGKTVQDRATAEVKQMLQTKKSGRETTLDRLIDAKIEPLEPSEGLDFISRNQTLERLKARYAFAKFLELSPAIDTTEKQQKLDQLVRDSVCSTCLEDIFAFIDALDSPTAATAKSALVIAARLDDEHYFTNTFIPYHVFRSSFTSIIQFVQLFTEEVDTAKVCGALAKWQLVCGNVGDARSLHAMIHPAHPEHYALVKEIDNFCTAFSKLNLQMVQNPAQFEQEIHTALDTLDPFLSTKIIGYKSFQRALPYAHSLEPELRSAVLTRLVRCDSLKKVSHDAADCARQSLEQEITKWQTPLINYLEVASETQDTKPLHVFIQSIQYPSFRRAASLVASLHMCNCDLYEQSYDFMQQEYELSRFMSDYSQKIKTEIINKLLEKGEQRWVEQFLRLE